MNGAMGRSGAAEEPAPQGKRLAAPMDKAHSEPSEVTAEEGEVIVEGPEQKKRKKGS